MCNFFFFWSISLVPREIHLFRWSSNLNPCTYCAFSLSKWAKLVGTNCANFISSCLFIILTIVNYEKISCQLSHPSKKKKKLSSFPNILFLLTFFTCKIFLEKFGVAIASRLTHTKLPYTLTYHAFKDRKTFFSFWPKKINLCSYFNDWWFYFYLLLLNSWLGKYIFLNICGRLSSNFKYLIYLS